MKNMAPLQSGDSNELELSPEKEAPTRDCRRMTTDDGDDGDDDGFLDPRTRSWDMSQTCRSSRTCPCPSSSSS